MVYTLSNLPPIVITYDIGVRIIGGGAVLQEDQRFVDPKAKCQSWAEQLLYGDGGEAVKRSDNRGSRVI